MATKSSIGQLYFLSLARISLGLIFLWAFFDKLFGLNYSTVRGKAWVDGVSPTMGFLKYTAQGPLAAFYHSIAGNPVVDVLFMLGLLGIGLALTFGFALRLAGYLGALLVLLMWSVVLPPQQNPILDEHIVYFFILLAVAQGSSGELLSISKWWNTTELVKRFSFLQ